MLCLNHIRNQNDFGHVYQSSSYHSKLALQTSWKWRFHTSIESRITSFVPLNVHCVCIMHIQCGIRGVSITARSIYSTLCCGELPSCYPKSISFNEKSWITNEMAVYWMQLHNCNRNIYIYSIIWLKPNCLYEVTTLIIWFPLHRLRTQVPRNCGHDRQIWFYLNQFFFFIGNKFAVLSKGNAWNIELASLREVFNSIGVTLFGHHLPLLLLWKWGETRRRKLE